MQPRDVRLSVRLEHLATTAGLTLAGAGLLTLLLCATGLRGMNTLFADWALLAVAATPASHHAWLRLAPLFWSSRPARDTSMTDG